jgi:AAA15 family ATPase/GTPase
MLTQIHAKNFKSWADTGQLRIAPLTGFFGTNSSGKSSLLQLLLLLKQTAEARDPNIVLKTQGGKDGLVDLGLVTDVIHQYSENIFFEFGLHWQTRLDADQIFEIEAKIEHKIDTHIEYIQYKSFVIQDHQKLHISNYTSNGDKLRLVKALKT